MVDFNGTKEKAPEFPNSNNNGSTGTQTFGQLILLKGCPIFQKNLQTKCKHFSGLFLLT
jgi:hypothetical protein